MRMMLRALSRVAPKGAISCTACGDCEAPKRKYSSGSLAAMNRTERSQKAHVPSKRMMAATSYSGCPGLTAVVGPTS